MRVGLGHVFAHEFEGLLISGAGDLTTELNQSGVRYLPTEVLVFGEELFVVVEVSGGFHDVLFICFYRLF